MTRKVFAATAAKPAPVTTAPTDSAPAPVKAAKREHAKETIRRIPAGLQTKALPPAGAALAVTNAVPTNAVPTTAVMPTLKRKP